MKIKFERRGKIILLATVISLLVSLLPLTATPVVGQQQELNYDDGSADFGFVAGPSVLGAVRLSVSSRMQVLKLKFHVWGDMKNVRVHALDANFESLYSRVVMPSSGWFEVDISGNNVFVSGDFYVGWQWISESPSGPWLGVDNSPPHHQRSYLGTPGARGQSAPSNEDYMIRAVVRTVAEEHPGGWEIRNVDLSGRGNYIEVNPDEEIGVSFDYQLWNPDNCPSCIQQIVVGIGNGARYCAYDGIPGTHPGESGRDSHTIIAPNSPGTYSLIAANDYQYNCRDAMDRYPEQGEKTTIATIRVLAPSGERGDLRHFDLDYRGDDPATGRGDGNDQHSVTVQPGQRLVMYLFYKEGDAGNNYIIRTYPEWNRDTFIVNSDNDEGTSEIGREIGGQRYDVERYTVPSQAGSYKVRVVYNEGTAPPSWNGYDRLLGEYTVVVSQPQPSGDRYEPDDTYQEATRIPTDGTRQTHNFEPAGDRDWVKFEAASGTQYTIETSNLASDSDTYIYLYDRDGTTEIDRDDDGGAGRASEITWTCPRSGTYYVMIRHYGDSAHGPDTQYDISLREEAAPPPSGDGYEPDNTYQEATRIPTDGTRQTHNFEPAGDRDWVKFEAASGTQYTIETSNLASDSDTYIYLYDRDGTTEIDRDDDGGAGRASEITWTCPRSGTYYVMIRHYRSSAHGPDTQYDISVIGETAPPPEVPPVYKQLVTVENVALSSDNKVAYFEIRWKFLVYPVGPSDIHTWPPFTEGQMRITPPDGVGITYFQVNTSVSDPWDVPSIAIWGVEQVLDVIVPGAGKIFGLMKALYEDFERFRADDIQVASIEGQMENAGYFTEMVFIVQLKSETPRTQWPLVIDASAIHMQGPNMPHERIVQHDTVILR